MIAFAAAVATSPRAVDAARRATADGLTALRVPPVLAITFADSSYVDADRVPAAVRSELGDVQTVGGSAAGAVFAGGSAVQRGVLVCLLGGDGVRSTTVEAPIRSPDLLDVVPAAAQLLVEADRAAEIGLGEGLCLAFGPGLQIEGESLVAAIRKGTAARIQLAGALTEGSAEGGPAMIFAGSEAHVDRVVLAGLFMSVPAGVAARHGYHAIGPQRVVTRSDGRWLIELDGRPALEAWLADARDAGFRPSDSPVPLDVQLSEAHALGLDVPSHVEPLVRAPRGARLDGAVLLTSAVAEGTPVKVMQASSEEMLEASRWAGQVALERAGGACVGALVLASASRLTVLGGRFDEETAAIARAINGAIAGACVRGELARAHREVDAYHNGTAVVVGWPRLPGRARAPK